MYCDKCGEIIPKGSSFCRFCGHQQAGITESKAKGERAQLSGKALAAGIGAVIILISLAFPWYAVRFSDASFDSSFFPFNISFIDLITGAGNGGPAWAGSALPVVAVITFASFTLLTVIYNLLEDIEDAKDAKFWSLLGMISAGCIIFNAVYLLCWMYYYSGEWVNLVNPGIVIAFIGAVIMVFSCALPARVTPATKS